MKRYQSLRFMGLVQTACAFFLPTLLTAGNPQFEIVEIPCDACYGTAINDRGQVAVLVNTPAGTESFLWKDGERTTLPAGTRIHAINARGEAVGAVTVLNRLRAALWSRGTLTDLGVEGVAYGINDHTEIVGQYGDASRPGYAFLWRNGVLTELGSLSTPGWNTGAVAINNRTQVVGSSDVEVLGGFTQHAFLWEDGIMKDLGTLSEDPIRSSFPVGINDRGQVLGASDAKVFLWERGVMKDVGLPRWTRAQAINNRGDIVGFFAVPDGVRAFLWTNGVMTELGTLGGRSAVAYAVNDNGEIAGWSERADGTSTAVVWRRSR